MNTDPFLLPVKVFHITNTLQIGGAETSLGLLVKNLDLQRFRPTVICTQAGGPLEESLAQAGIRIIKLNRPLHSILYFPLFLRDVWGTLWELYRLFKKEKPAIIQTYLPASEYLALIAGRWAGVPVLIYTFLTSNFLPERAGKSLRTWLRLRLTRWLCGFSQAIVANSQAVKDTLLELFPQYASLIRVVRQGIDLTRFEGMGRKEAIKKKIGLDPDAPLIAGIGRLSPVKNQAMLLKAFQRISQRHPAAGLVLVGEGPMRDPLLDLRSELGLEARVHLLGRINNVADVLAETDIFVSTSRWEGLPLALLEAMAASVPVVATAVPGNQEVLEKGGGILVPLDDLEELEKALERLIEDPSLRSNQGQKGRAWAFEHYSLPTYLQRWHALYGELLGIPKPGRHFPIEEP